MKRRELITLLGGAATWPLAARAQQPAMPVIGFISARSVGDSDFMLPAFRQGLKDAGFTEGQNVTIDYRFVEGEYNQLAAAAADLVRRQVTVIAAISGTPTALAAKAATTSIPIVFANGGDPVSSGLVANPNRPGGNITGVSFLNTTLAAKRVELLRELATPAVIGFLVNPSNPVGEPETKDTEAAARALGLPLRVLIATNEHDLDTAFASLLQQQGSALLVGSDPFFGSWRDKLAELARRHAVPTVYTGREFAEAGGLMSYGTDLADSFREAGFYVGRILKGEKPANLPVMQPTKFELVINLKAAKAIGLTVPPLLLARADEVIE
jgi:putative ABC transport system substrate-binding protein